MVHLQAVVILVVLGTALALPQRYLIVPLISRTDTSEPSGAYHTSYQTGDGARVEETGYPIRTNDGSDTVIAKRGNYAYTSPEGKPVSVSYIADEYGFRAVGDVIPVGPPANPPTQQTF